MNPTPGQIKGALEHVRYEIESFLQSPEYNPANKALQESVYFRRMAHCRNLYQFFTKKKRKDKGKRIDDDILSEDFGFRLLPGWQNASDIPKNFDQLMRRGNKDLLHLTYDRLGRSPKQWPCSEIFPPVARWSEQFIDHILTRPTETVSQEERTAWLALKSAIHNRAPLHQDTSNVALLATKSIEIAPPPRQ